MPEHDDEETPAPEVEDGGPRRDYQLLRAEGFTVTPIPDENRPSAYPRDDDAYQYVCGGWTRAQLNEQTQGELRLENGRTLRWPNDENVPFPTVRYHPDTFSTYYSTSANMSAGTTSHYQIWYDQATNQLNFRNGNWYTTQMTLTDEQRQRLANPEYVDQESVAEREVRLEAARARQREAEERRAAEVQERRRTRQRAVNRASKFLLAHLSDEQKSLYEQQGYFDIIGSLGTRFRIGRGTSGNIRVFTPDGLEFARICAHPAGDLPEPDVHLAQMLALMSDEEAFVRCANLHNGQRVFYETAEDGARVAHFRGIALRPSSPVIQPAIQVA